MKKVSKQKSPLRLTSIKKNSDNLKVIAGSSEFQEEIKEIRKFLEIPEDGFGGDKATTKAEEWTRNKLIEMDEICESKSYKEEMKAIHTKCSSGEIDMREANKLYKELNSKLPFNYLTASIKELIQKFRLPTNYDYALRIYILYGTVSCVPNNFSVTRHKDGHISVNVYTKLTDDDLKDIKYEVNKLSGKHLPLYRDIKENVDRLLELEKLHKNLKIYEKDSDTEDNASAIYKKLSHEEVIECSSASKTKKKKAEKAKENLRKLRRRRSGH